MCGIAGIVAFNGKADAQAVSRMGEALAHRGPDGNWTWISEKANAAFAYRRLAIVDPSHCLFEPFIWQNKFLVLYNGEIYNYRELRNDLEKSGYTFTSASDAEVLPALYDCYGESCLEKIDGMFSFALWDVEMQELFCARDRLGEKPFFYSFDGKQFCFASEIKALRAAGFDLKIDERMLFLFLGYNLVENPSDISQTFYQGVLRLPPATWLKVSRDGRLKQHTYWQLETGNDKKIDLHQAIETFTGLLRESVQRRMQADAEVGCTISGGLDSSSLLALMRESKTDDILTFSARVRDKELDEGPFVATLLQHIPAINYEAWVDEGMLIQALDEVMQHQEEPVADLSVLAQEQLMRLVANHNIKVLLDGQGADEMLAGYYHFFSPYFKEQFSKSTFTESLRDAVEKHGKYVEPDMLLYMEMFLPDVRGWLSKLRRSIITPPYLRYMHPQFVKSYVNQSAPFERFDSLQQALHYRTTRYGLHKLLRYADRNGMAHGIEVRFPFLYHKLVEFVFTLQSDMKIHHGWTKYILRKAMEDKLPSSIAWRTDKLGYQIPSRTWMQHPRVIEMVRDAQHHLASRKIVKPDVRLNFRESSAVLIASRFVK